MKLTRRKFLEYLALTGATLLGAGFAGCEQKQPSTYEKEIESKPSHSSNIDERIIEEVKRKGKEINDLGVKMIKTFSSEGGERFADKWEMNLWYVGYFFPTPEPFFENLFFRRTSGSIDEKVMAYLTDLYLFVLPFYVVHFLYDHEERLRKCSDKVRKKIKEAVENWDRVLLEDMEYQIKHYYKRNPAKLFFILDPRIAKKHEDELQDVFERFPKTTEIYFEELPLLLNEYGLVWREDYKKREDEIEKEIEETLKYAEKITENEDVKREVSNFKNYGWVDIVTGEITEKIEEGKSIKLIRVLV